MKTRWLLGAAGCLLMAYALTGALTDRDASPFGHLALLAAVLVGHDAVLMPVAIAVGLLVGRFAKGSRAVLQAALFVSAVLAFVTLPLLLGPGGTAGNPSALPRDYARGLLVMLAAVWLTAGAVLLIARGWRGTRSRRAARSSGPAPDLPRPPGSGAAP